MQKTLVKVMHRKIVFVKVELRNKTYVPVFYRGNKTWV